MHPSAKQQYQYFQCILVQNSSPQVDNKWITVHSAFAVQHTRLLCTVRKAGARYVRPSLSTIGRPNPLNVKLIMVTMTFESLWICICSQSRVSINHFHMIVKAVNAMHRTASWPPSPVSQLDAT